MAYKNPEDARAYRKRWKAANPDKVKAYQRKQHLKRIYGIAPEDYDRMLEKQDGKCAICRTTKQKGGRFERFCVDHDHSTGAVRDLLCYDCNFALGKFNDNIGNLEAAIHYLKSNG